MVDMDVFQSAPLGSLNFNEEPNPSTNKTSTKSNIDITPSITPSLSLDTLIEQNDDLMLKLKTAIRRLNNLESEFAGASEENLRLRTAFSQMQDQIFVLKEEKENHLRQAERDRQLTFGFEKEISSLRAQVQRYHKYHEKVKTQVKPYMQELKIYAARLESDKLNLEKELVKKESLTQDLRTQIRDIIKNAQFEMEDQSKKFEAMVNYFETEMKSREKIYSEQKESMAELNVKVQMLANIKQSRDLMENHMIELEKSKDDMQVHMAKEIKELQFQMQFQHQERSRLDIELKDLKTRHNQMTKEKSMLETKNREMTAQVDSLRTMWNEQQIEVEKLRKSQEALERLNLELSQKLASQPR